MLGYGVAVTYRAGVMLMAPCGCHAVVHSDKRRGATRGQHHHLDSKE